jgi:hypothetical protein
MRRPLASRDLAELRLLRSYLRAFGPAGPPVDAAAASQRARWLAVDRARRLAWLGLTEDQAAALGYPSAAAGKEQSDAKE